MATMDEKEKMHKETSATGVAESAEPTKEEKKKSLMDRLKEEWEAIGDRASKGQKIMDNTHMFQKGGKVDSKAKKYSGGGSSGSASRRADGCAVRGKTKGRMV